MHRLQEFVRLHRMSEGPREICRLLAMSPKTELKYRKAFRDAEVLDGEADELPSAEALRAVVDKAYPKLERPAVTTSVDAWLSVIEAAFDKGIGAKALWDKLRRDDETFDASYTAVRRAYRRLRDARGVDPSTVVIPVDTAPGQVAQVDFGYAGRFFDTSNGKARKAWVFVMVLGFSRHMFAKLVFDQKTDTWLRLHIEAFKHFGGAPRVIVPDNLKAAVVRAAFGASDRHCIGLNRSYRELALYYGCKIDPAPVRAPKKKGKVESGVAYVKHNGLATNEAEELVPANVELLDWVMRTAGTRTHGTTGRQPLELFEEAEHGALLRLPKHPFEPIVWKKATVHRDSHVEVDGKLYSVPWRLVGRSLWVKASRHSIEVYSEDARVATHERVKGGRRATNPAHLPEHRRDLAYRCEDYWRERADALDPIVGQYIGEVFDSDPVLSKLRRDVQAIVTELEKYPLHRAVGAVQRARFFGNHSFQGVRGILRRALDLEPLPACVLPSAHPNGEHRFARSADELLAHALETTHEPH